jgi:transcriptional regulator with XRE-family HTH domain
MLGTTMQDGAPATAGETVGDRVRALRKTLGLTQEQLADAGELDRTEVTRVENGYNQATSGRIREKLARGFGLSLENTYAFLDGKIDVEAALGLSSRKPPEAS